MRECEQCTWESFYSGVTDCTSIDTNAMEELINTVENEKIYIGASLCVDILSLSEWLSNYFLIDYCILEHDLILKYMTYLSYIKLIFKNRIYEEVFSINVSLGEEDILEIYTDFIIKLTDGPDCLCETDTFENSLFCKMNKGDMDGKFGVIVDFYFYRDEFKIIWNKENVLIEIEADDDSSTTTTSTITDESGSTTTTLNSLSLLPILAYFVL